MVREIIKFENFLAIVFLDEPTPSFDAITNGQIKNSLDALKHGRTVVIISHCLELHGIEGRIGKFAIPRRGA